MPIDERNAVIVANDSATDNWTGEYAMLLANSGGPPLAGIIVNPSAYWPDLAANVAVWNEMITAARASGLDVPDATPSAGEPLVRPADGAIESTAPNGSAGAKLIVDLSARLSRPWRPLVVVTGSRLTDVADAYLIDRTVADRVVVVSALGGAAATGGSVMGWPNGELDAWADWIVGQRFRYIQVNGYYDQLGDVSSAATANLPANAFGTWMAAKVPSLFQIPMSSDQIGVLAVGLPAFVTAVSRAVVDTSAAFDATTGPPLVGQADGSTWVVPSCDSGMAADRLWRMLRDPGTFAR